MNSPDREKDKPKTKKLVSGLGLKNLIQLVKPKNKNDKKSEKETKSTVNVNLLEFRRTSEDQSEGKYKKVVNSKGKNSSESDDCKTSPCNSRSGRLELCEKKPMTLDKLDILFARSRSSSEQSITFNESSEIKLKQWKYKVVEYQEKYHLLVQEKLNENNSENCDFDLHWDGSFPKRTDSYQLLKKLARATNLSKIDIALVKWTALTEIQTESPSILMGGAISLLFDQIIEFLNQHLLSDDLIERFWESAENLIVQYVAYLTTTVGCVKILKGQPEVNVPILCFIRFVEMLRSYVNKSRSNVSIAEVKLFVTMEFVMDELSKEFAHGASQWFESLVSLFDDCTIVTLTDIASILQVELSRRKDNLNNLLASCGVILFDIVYSVWTTKFGEIVTPVIVNSCARRQEFARQDISNSTKIDVDGATDLYNLLEASKNVFLLADKPKFFHEFFRPCIPLWLDVNCIKALTHLEKAVAIDDFEVIHPTLRVSGSAIDAGSLFDTMDRLWKELNWPDLEERYTIAVLLIKNLDHCIVYYAELIHNRLKELGKTSFEDYEIPDQLCVAYSNMEKVRLFADSVVNELQIPTILHSITEKRGGLISLQQCHSTPPALMENLTDKVNRKMLEYFTAACDNIEPMIWTLLETAAGSFQLPDVESLKRRLISHLNRVLYKLKSKLSLQGFDKAFPILWSNVFNSYLKIVESTVEANKPPVVFEHLLSLFHCLETLFFPEPNESAQMDQEDRQCIQDLKATLQTHAKPTSKLILEYYEDRFETQTELGLTQFNGNQNFLTVVTDRNTTDGQLRLQILNSVLPQNNRDCFVKFQIITPEFSETTKKYSTGVAKKDQYLIFEDLFSVNLTDEDWTSGGIIRFWMRGRAGLRWNEFLGEAFLHLKDIRFASKENAVKNSAQKRLPLTKPSDPNSKFLQLLQGRTFDKVATKFVSKELESIHSFSNEAIAIAITP